MPKFLIKHGCCYIPTVGSESSTATTCEVFTNPDFDRRLSEALCSARKSSPEIVNQNIRQFSWGYLDEVPFHSSNSPPENLQESPEVHETQETHNIGIQAQENREETLSLHTIFGNDTDKYDSDRNINDRPHSDVSIYRPTTRTIPNMNLTSSDKFLDFISMCLWKCSSWCQKIE